MTPASLITAQGKGRTSPTRHLGLEAMAFLKQLSICFYRQYKTASYSFDTGTAIRSKISGQHVSVAFLVLRKTVAVTSDLRQLCIDCGER